MAARPGFEPGLTAPKADVLPLHHRAKLGSERSVDPLIFMVTILILRSGSSQEDPKSRRCYNSPAMI